VFRLLRFYSQHASQNEFGNVLGRLLTRPGMTIRDFFAFLVSQQVEGLVVESVSLVPRDLLDLADGRMEAINGYCRMFPQPWFRNTSVSRASTRRI
jgi:hypothetical protein